MKAILFDADGVLFDATELHKVTFNAALSEYGYSISDEEHEKVFNGLPTRIKLDILTEMKGVPRELHAPIEALKQRKTLETIPQTIKPMIEMLDVLNKAYAKGVILAICSNARLKSVEAMARCARIAPYFSLTLGNESVLRTKPYPDIYLLAAKQLDIPIAECAIVEDSPKGLVAAISAGPGRVVKVSSIEDTVRKIEELLY